MNLRRAQSYLQHVIEKTEAIAFRRYCGGVGRTSQVKLVPTTPYISLEGHSQYSEQQPACWAKIALLGRFRSRVSRETVVPMPAARHPFVAVLGRQPHGCRSLDSFPEHVRFPWVVP